MRILTPLDLRFCGENAQSLEDNGEYNNVMIEGDRLWGENVINFAIVAQGAGISRLISGMLLKVDSHGGPREGGSVRASSL